MRSLAVLLLVFACRAQTVKVAPYYSAGIGSASLTSAAATDTSIDWIAVGQTDRMLMPRTGSVTKVRVYIADRANVSALYVGVCRWSSGAIWNVAQWTLALSPIFSGEVNTYTLATPLSASKYDVMCGRIEWATPHATNAAPLSSIFLPQITGSGNTALAEKCYSQLNASRPTSLTTASMTLIGSSGCPVIEAWMGRPDIVGIGDSIMMLNDSVADAGVALTYPLASGVQQTGLSIPHYFAANYSLTYQDMGWGGQTTVQINARFAQDAIALKPAFLVLNGGVNDVYLNCSTSTGCTAPQSSTIVTALEAMLSAARTAGIKVFLMLIGPWTGNGSDATTAQMTSIDSIDATLLADGPGLGATVIDQRCVVGQFRSGGTAGNCWDIQPAYLVGDGLGVHLNAAGEQAVANLIALSLPASVDSGSLTITGPVTQ